MDWSRRPGADIFTSMDTNTIILLAFALIAVGLLRNSIARKRDLADPTEITEALQNGALIVDVRTPAEYDQDHFPGAVNIPLQEIGQRATELMDQHIILYCNTGNRTSSAATILKRKGVTSIVNAGGLHQLRNAAP
jgi:phage shock protein E